MTKPSNTFGPESTNPRLRRAYAHAVIAEVRAEDSSDIDKVEDAIKSAEGSYKSRTSGFDGALINTALADTNTRTIVATGNMVLNTTLTPRKYLTWTGTNEDRHNAVSARAYSSDYDLMAKTGATIGITEIRDKIDDKLIASECLVATDHESSSSTYGRPRTIPLTQDHRVDTMTVRRMPYTTRAQIGSIASRVAISIN